VSATVVSFREGCALTVRRRLVAAGGSASIDELRASLRRWPRGRVLRAVEDLAAAGEVALFHRDGEPVSAHLVADLATFEALHDATPELCGHERLRLFDELPAATQERLWAALAAECDRARGAER
jgi:hypothetical protein